MAATKDFQVSCPDHPEWSERGLTARLAKAAADQHDDSEHHGQSIAQTEKQPPEQRAAKKR